MAFGRNVYASEVIAKIENVDGVDLVQDLELKTDSKSIRKYLLLGKNALTKYDPSKDTWSFKA